MHLGSCLRSQALLLIPNTRSVLPGCFRCRWATLMARPSLSTNAPSINRIDGNAQRFGSAAVAFEQIASSARCAPVQGKHVQNVGFDFGPLQLGSAGKSVQNVSLDIGLDIALSA